MRCRVNLGCPGADSRRGRELADRCRRPSCRVRHPPMSSHGQVLGSQAPDHTALPLRLPSASRRLGAEPCSFAPSMVMKRSAWRSLTLRSSRQWRGWRFCTSVVHIVAEALHRHRETPLSMQQPQQTPRRCTCRQYRPDQRWAATSVAAVDWQIRSTQRSTPTNLTTSTSSARSQVESRRLDQ